MARAEPDDRSRPSVIGPVLVPQLGDANRHLRQIGEQALGDLDAIDPEAVQLVELRYFAGLPLEQIAPLLGVSERTLKRRWRTARAFLHRQLGAAGHDA